MEIGDDGGDGKRTPAAAAEERPTKRMMKSPFQLEMLEKTYASDPYPSESVRADLSAQIGLTDRQLQMWFCHRRLKDRKPSSSSSSSSKRARKDEQEPSQSHSHSPPLMPPPPLFPPLAVDTLLGPGSMPVPIRTAGRGSTALPRLGPPRYYEPAIMAPPLPVSVQLSAREMRAVANVERMLGGPLREDGPILGTEFEPLPPGAFGAPLVPEQQKQPVRSYDSKLFTRHEPKALKASAFLSMDDSFNNPTHSHSHSHSNKRKAPSSSSSHKAPKEYQFLPEQPSYERVPPPPVSHQPPPASHHFYESPNPGYTFQGQIVSTPPVRTQVLSTPVSATEYEVGQTGQTMSGSGSYGNTAILSESQFGANLSGSDSKRVVSHEEEAARLERKRKSDEARIAKEVEAHEKRIRRELEKQDMLRRKREEQVRKEMERQDRERRKEEERLLRERQREEERFQREQKKEIERREKFLIKESLRAEKQRQKEEQRKEREVARQKAATERATARKIAREYMELIEDERLELMEIAAHKKGLPSMLNLDTDTLNQLHSFRDLLSKFPPDSVQLKRPFALEPWTGSEDNVGNLLMVWQFLITFADVLGLWAFTLDEFVQALHDYESRLLGEIHVSLLRGIIKDIEDVARAPAVTFGANQSSANSSGGHPQIVEGAYAWGFSIRNWQKHLGFLTWPEILRQFALSSGFGPKLKTRTPKRIHYHDDHEGEDGENIIMTLRDGSAAVNAVALMKERGYSHKRKSRHRLTPGTVKFAAFHVLSLEGSHGLTILEVADRIQKSGLRDLTTSKTPEASIAAALSRDVKLFERTAPSTYCVRTPYRKDPVNTDEILSAALEKIKAFQNNLSDSDAPGKDVVEDHEDADVDADDVIIREEEDSECEDDADVDPPDSNDASLVPKSENVIKNVTNVPVVTGELSTPVTNSLIISSEASESIQKPNKSTASSSASETVPPSGTQQQLEETEIDESNYGEAWVQGLSEGEYSELSVEEKLKALVALTGIAIAGNSIRAILEERLEAANALKKQMWADAQIDKRRIKEDNSSKTPQFIPSSSHPNNHDISDTTPIKNEELLLANGSNNLEAMHQQYGFAEKSRAELKAFIGHQAEREYVYRSLPLGQDRRRNRYWVFSTSAAPNDPGSGRIIFESRDGSWRLIDSEEALGSLMASLDTRGIRESHLHSMLLRIESTFKEAIKRRNSNSFIGESSLSPNSTNNNLSDSSSTSTLICSSEKNNLYSDSFKIELGRTETEKHEIIKRYNEFINWMRTECFEKHALNANKYGKKRVGSELVIACDVCYKTYLAEEGHCFTCHEEFRGYGNFAEHLKECEERKRDPNWRVGVRETVPVGMGIKVLKTKLAIVEVSLPEEALKPYWTEEYRKSWGARLQDSSSVDEVFQLLTLLEGAINQEYLSSSFETTSELLRFSNSDYMNPFASIPVLPWVPETAPAVALRLLDLDSSVCYTVLEKNESFRDKHSDDFLNFPSRYATLTNPHELTPNQPPSDPLDFHFTPPSRRGRGRGIRGGSTSRTPRGRGRGGRPPKHLSASSENPYLKPKRSYNRRGGRPRGSGRKRGRRSVRGQAGRGGGVEKESLLGSFGGIGGSAGGGNNRLDADGRINRDVDVVEGERSSGEENWGVETREDLLNGEMSGDEYVERTSSQYSGDYVHEENEEVEDEEEEDNDVMMDGNNNIGNDVDEEEEEEEEEEDDDNQYGVQYVPQRANHKEEDDDVEMMDEDEEDEDDGVVGNNNQDDDNDGGYSDYSD